MDTANFQMSLVVMGKGMVGIFFFMSAFYGLILLLRKLFPAEEDTKG